MVASGVDRFGPLDRLELVPDEVELRIQDGNRVRRPVSHFLNYMVNGKSLLHFFRSGGEFVTELNRAWVPDLIPEHVAVLLGRQPARDLEPGRVPLLVCAMCGDIGCGALTARLTLTSDTVRWSDFRWEDGTDDSQVPEALPDGLTFDRHQYEEDFERAVRRVSELPYDKDEHTARGFLWPWQWGWRLPRGD